MSLFDTGVRPLIDAYLKEKSEQVRDYGDYWSASSAGYCMRLNIFRRLGVPRVPEIQEGWERTTRVFESGHIFHSWIQGVTKGAGISIAQEVELQDEDLMVRGHFDDLVLIKTTSSHHISPTLSQEVTKGSTTIEVGNPKGKQVFNILETDLQEHLILYDYKTAHSKSFEYAKGRPMSYFHKMQLGTYMYMLRNSKGSPSKGLVKFAWGDLTEARILKISKDDLRFSEDQLLWSEELGNEVTNYWTTLNKYWADKKLPKCTCLDQEGGFMGRRTKAGKVYNDFFYNDEPCSLEWYTLNKEKGLLK